MVWSGKILLKSNAIARAAELHGECFSLLLGALIAEGDTAAGRPKQAHRGGTNAAGTAGDQRCTAGKRQENARAWSEMGHGYDANGFADDEQLPRASKPQECEKVMTSEKSKGDAT